MIKLPQNWRGAPSGTDLCQKSSILDGVPKTLTSKRTRELQPKKGRIIREFFFDTFPNGEESIHKYENELLVESTHIAEEYITRDIYNYDSEGIITNQQTLVGDELFQETLFT